MPRSHALFRTSRLSRLPFFIALLAAPQLFGAAIYSITDLRTLGGNSSQAFGINSHGQVVGTSRPDSSIPASKHAFLFSGGVMSDLGTIDGSVSGALGINDAGQIAGYSSTTPTSGNLHAFLYSAGAMTDLGTLGGVVSKAYAINNNGQIVGTAWNASGTSRPFLYSSGTMIDLGVGPADGEATSINDSGQITGWFTTNCNCSADAHAFVYNGGAVIDLGAQAGLGSLKAQGGAGINNAGQIAGYAENSLATVTHPFLYKPGTLADLALTNTVFTNCAATAINNRGQIVGKDYSRNHAILCVDGVISDLNTLIDSAAGWTLITATAINDNGQIAGYGTSPSGEQHGFLLTPRPVLQRIAVVGGRANFELLGMTGVTYRVEYASSLLPTSWTLLTNVAPPASPVSIADPSPLSGQRVYRAVLVP